MSARLRDSDDKGGQKGSYGKAAWTAGDQKQRSADGGVGEVRKKKER